MIVPQQRLDENGIEEITAIFSSPRKSSPLKNAVADIETAESQSTLPRSAGMSGMGDGTWSEHEQTFRSDMPHPIILLLSSFAYSDNMC